MQSPNFRFAYTYSLSGICLTNTYGHHSNHNCNLLHLKRLLDKIHLNGTLHKELPVLHRIYFKLNQPYRITWSVAKTKKAKSKVETAKYPA